MAQALDKLELERELLARASRRGPWPIARTYLRLSGPGWLQSALTLGGGSLASSLYLGILAGFGLLWLQPAAMVLGIIMLSAIGYVTMSTGKRPFQAINEHINPVLGWGWAIGSLLASMVWCMPQYSLAVGVIQQNLLPGILGPGGFLGNAGARILVSAGILAAATLVTFSYGGGSRGIRLYELLLKLMVALIGLCFAGVTLRLSISGSGLDWSGVLNGFIPDIRRLNEPSSGLLPLLDAVPPAFRDFWHDLIVARQRDVLIAAAATAVGINMTFLFPYSILARGWTKEFRGLAKFDLGLGMLLPFGFATSLVVIAAASSFHGIPAAGPDKGTPLPAGMASEYRRLLDSRQASLPGEIGAAEERLAASLLTRDAGQLASALAPLTGDFFSHVVFGLGVLGMTLSTITLLMLVSGFVVCEMLGLPPSGWPHRLGSLAAVTGILGPFVWKDAAFYLAVPTSVFGMLLLPIAYLTFFLMMNSRSLLGPEIPRGGRRWAWNVLMGLAALTASLASLTVAWTKAGWWGIAFLAMLVILAFWFRPRPRPS